MLAIRQFGDRFGGNDMTVGKGRKAHRPCGRHRRHVPRTLHLIDLENLCRVTPRSVSRAWRLYTASVGVYNDDGVMVAVDVSRAFTVADALPSGIRLLTGRGRNGADRALLEAVDIGWAKRCFERVVVASGDHVFAPTVRECLAADMPVEVVAGGGGVARVLTETGVTVHRLTAA